MAVADGLNYTPEEKLKITERQWAFALFNFLSFFLTVTFLFSVNLCVCGLSICFSLFFPTYSIVMTVYHLNYSTVMFTLGFHWYWIWSLILHNVFAGARILCWCNDFFPALIKSKLKQLYVDFLYYNNSDEKNETLVVAIYAICVFHWGLHSVFPGQICEV